MGPEAKKEVNQLEDNSEKLNEKKKVAINTIPGISNLFYWEWPIDGPFAGYIQAQPMPNFGDFVRFSPATIANFSNNKISRPEPVLSSSTVPKNKWTMAQSNDELMNVDQIYGFEKGWALKGNQKYGKKGSGKRIKKHVKQLLIKFVESGEVDKEDVPNLSTIKNWINSYSAEFKEQTTQKKKIATKINNK
ncbi:5574_t:CDS:2 [Cetraspora pellucida]|uniref:5574_t:CDS:1 n=1 Tax=Cetraspora pellucida TaxID=1433469 RepID=A0ACA9LNM5_9GLOM|nr:5574_t:CDS:2 [Cetraspora pellucida]